VSTILGGGVGGGGRFARGDGWRSKFHAEAMEGLEEVLEESYGRVGAPPPPPNHHRLQES